MTTFNTQRSVVRNIVLSMLAQEAIGEVFADASLTYRARPETSAFAQWTGEYEGDINFAGKGKSTPTESHLITEQSGLELSARLDDYLAGWLPAFCMGQETFTLGVGGAANTHLFTWKDTADPAPLTNAYIEDSLALKRKWSDLAVSQFVLSGTDKGSVMAKAKLIGLGTITDAVMAALPALPTAQYLYGSGSTVLIGPVGAPVSLSPRVLSWEATFDYQDELFRACGGGTKPYFVVQGNPVNKLKLVIAVDTTSDVRDWVKNQTALEIKIAIASGATSMTIDYVNVNLPQYSLGEQDKRVAYTVDLDQNFIKQPAGGGDAVSITVLNTDTAYLVGV